MKFTPMKYCDFTAATPAENLAYDEALLDRCEAGAEEAVLRVWEPTTPFVVLGYGNRMEEEVHVAACRRLRIPILRRASGGGTVVQGPGCLNYSVAIRHEGRGPFATLRGAMCHVLERHQKMLQPLLGRRIEIAGTSDLTIGGRKFSGNAQRRKRHAALVHGTFLLSFDLPLIERVLSIPARQPAYRARRPHTEFLMNLHLPATRLTAMLREAWQATAVVDPLPETAIASLTRRHADPAWIRRG